MPGIIGSDMLASSDSEEDGLGSESKKVAPLYKDFKEFVIDLGNKEARNIDTHDATAAQLKSL